MKEVAPLTVLNVSGSAPCKYRAHIQRRREILHNTVRSADSEQNPPLKEWLPTLLSLVVGTGSGTGSGTDDPLRSVMEAGTRIRALHAEVHKSPGQHPFNLYRARLLLRFGCVGFVLSLLL